MASVRYMKSRNLIILLAIGIVIGALITYIAQSTLGRKDSNSVISHAIVIESIENIGRLEVTRYNLKDIIEYKKIRQWLPNAKTAMIISGEIVVCIDLAKITPDDIHTSGDSIHLVLPEPEICHAKINHAESKVYNLEFGFWESEQIMDEAYRYAEKQLYAEGQKLDIKNRGRENAANLLTPILRTMGFNHITITLKPRGKEYR